MMRNWRERIGGLAFGWIIIAGIFCIVQLTWYWGIKIRYDDAIQDVFAVTDADRNGMGEIGNGTYEAQNGRYRYRVRGTKYLKSSGYASISAENGWIEESEKPEDLSAYGKTNVILNIGFKMFCNYTYQLDIENAEERYQIEVDRYGKLVAGEYMKPEQRKKMDDILKQNKEEIDRLFYCADEMWEIR